MKAVVGLGSSLPIIACIARRGGDVCTGAEYYAASQLREWISCIIHKQRHGYAGDPSTDSAGARYLETIGLLYYEGGEGGSSGGVCSLGDASVTEGGE